MQPMLKDTSHEEVQPGKQVGPSEREGGGGVTHVAKSGPVDTVTVEEKGWPDNLTGKVGGRYHGHLLSFVFFLLFINFRFIIFCVCFLWRCP